MKLFSHIPKQAWHCPMGLTLENPPQPKMKGLSDCGYYQGLPLGGLGTGGIGRNYRGSFTRWTLKTGLVHQYCEAANMFAVYQKRKSEKSGHAVVLHPGYPTAEPTTEPVVPKTLQSWNWENKLENCTYGAMFPKAWYHYAPTAEYPLEMLCEQFSPVIPHNYKETSLPIGVFKWSIHNPTQEPIDCSILFSFANMVGQFSEMSRQLAMGMTGGNFNTSFKKSLSKGRQIHGVLFQQYKNEKTRLTEGRGQIAIAALETGQVKVSHHATFNSNSDGSEVWSVFGSSGLLNNDDTSWFAMGHNPGALAASCAVAPGATIEIPMTLTWDLPVIRFGNGAEYYRRYTRFWGIEGNHAVDMAAEALTSYPVWSKQIDAWHRSVVEKQEMPDWFSGMLFNELYFIVDGLTAWTDKSVDGGAAEDFFGLIECPDYAFYNTYDLWVYASFVFSKNWPEIEKSVTRLFARFLLHGAPGNRMYQRGGYTIPVVKKGILPHDMGCPYEDPVNLPNMYTHQNSTVWKDLNSHFVLTVYRDYKTLRDEKFLHECYPAVKLALESMLVYDRDKDGLIENDNVPDQTFDSIPLNGPSSYCGGLWVAALAAGAKMAEIMGDTAAASQFNNLLEKAKVAFEKHLWTGTHYRVDTKSSYCNNVFIEQLFGIWYADVCGLGTLLPREHIQTALKTIFTSNFMVIDGEPLGVINIKGMAADVQHELSIFGDATTQTDEILCGINFSFANQLAYYGLKEESLQVFEAIYKVIYERGMWFRTPAAVALTLTNNFRAIMNMRPLVIWAYHLAE